MLQNDYSQKQKLQLQMTDNQMPTQNLKIFSLVRLKPQCKIIPVRADFSTPHRPNSAPTFITPTFNNDRCYFTPAFLLPTDEKYYRENTTFQKYQFEEKVQRSVQQTENYQSPSTTEDLLAAAPNSNYCQICQQKFQDYFAHLLIKNHRTRITHVEATALIHQICKEFSEKQKQLVGYQKTKGIRKEKKREIKGLSEKKINKNRKNVVRESQGSVKGQNYSTCILQDSQWELGQQN